MEKVTIIPAPKGTDPQDLCWKGAAVLGKMDGVADLWVTREDWVSVNNQRLHVRLTTSSSGLAWIERTEGALLLSLRIATRYLWQSLTMAVCNTFP